MIKNLALLLLASFVMPTAINVMAPVLDSTSEPNYVLEGEEDPDVLHGYTYTDTYAENGTRYRTFDTDEITPVAKRSFCKPSGYIFHFDAEEWQITEMMDQLRFAGSDLTWIELTCAYRLSGSTVTISNTLMPSFSLSI